jgi:hypothetical protein
MESHRKARNDSARISNGRFASKVSGETRSPDPLNFSRTSGGHFGSRQGAEVAATQASDTSTGESRDSLTAHLSLADAIEDILCVGQGPESNTPLDPRKILAQAVNTWTGAVLPP